MKYSKGVCWIEDCRIPFLQDEGYEYKNGPLGNSFSVGQEPDGKRTEPVESNPLGRFTPNLLCCDDALNDGNIVQYNKTRVDNGSYLGGHREEFVGTDNNPIKNKIKGQFFNDKGSNSKYYDLDLWFDNMLERL